MEGIRGIIRKFKVGREAKGLEHPHFMRREAAAVRLGEIGGEEAVPHLEKRLVDENWGVRMYVAKALGKIFRRTGSEEALEKLSIAIDDENPTVRKVALDELELAAKAGKPASEAALKHIARALNHKEDPFMRLYALGVLSRIGGEQVVKPLVDALGHSDPNVRVRAVDRLIEVGSTLPADEKARGKLHMDAKSLSVVFDHLRGSGDQRGRDAPDLVDEAIAKATYGKITKDNAEVEINGLRMKRREKALG